MSDLYYDVVRFVGTQIFWSASRPTILHRERLDRPGAFLVAGNHLSPFDVPLMIYSSRRRLDFVSITEVFKNPFVARFYGSMNAFPLERTRPDPATVRVVIDRLERGRAVAMFPEGNIRTEEKSALNGGPIKPGVARIARMANVPIVPVVVLNSGAFHRFNAWYPLRRTRWGLAVGDPITPDPQTDEDQDVSRMLDALRAAWYALRDELRDRMKEDPA